jgi:23S rRNA pseudouridine1911/1915/1917 synthase
MKMLEESLLTPTVLFDADGVVVVSKPAGMVVNRAETVSAGTTLQDWVEEQLLDSGQWSQFLKSEKPADQLFVSRSGIAHRLDKETSGALVIARTPEVLEGLLLQFKQREVEKEYVALVHGLLEPKVGVIHLPIGRLTTNRHRFGVRVEGKVAQTAYQVVSGLRMRQDVLEYQDYKDGFSLVHARPKTGRTHQIRVHLTHIGHPLVADALYGGKKRLQADLRWCGRHFLHAGKIRFVHPVTKLDCEVEAPLDADLKASLDWLMDRVEA